MATTKELWFPDFPYEEFTTRHARTQAALKSHGMDVPFLTQRQNLRHFAGLRHGSWDAYHPYFLIILFAEGHPVLLAANGFQNLLKQCWAEDLLYWGWHKEFYLATDSNAVPLILGILREKRLEVPVVGMEPGPDSHMHMARSHADAIIAGLPNAQIVDASDAIRDVRSVTCPSEIERLRKAAEITSRGVKVGFETLKPGMTEKELMRVVTSAMTAAGASELRTLLLYAGPRAMCADGLPTEYVIKDGDLMQFDGGCVYEGYWCDFKRMAAVGERRSDQRGFYNLAKQALFAAIETIRPGVPPRAP